MPRRSAISSLVAPPMSRVSAELAVKLTQSQHRQALNGLRRGRRVRVRLNVVATDRAGNSREAEAVTIRLVR